MQLNGVNSSPVGDRGFNQFQNTVPTTIIRQNNQDVEDNVQQNQGQDPNPNQNPEDSTKFIVKQEEPEGVGQSGINQEDFIGGNAQQDKVQVQDPNQNQNPVNITKLEVKQEEPEGVGQSIIGQDVRQQVGPMKLNSSKQNELFLTNNKRLSYRQKLKEEEVKIELNCNERKYLEMIEKHESEKEKCKKLKRVEQQNYVKPFLEEFRTLVKGGFVNNKKVSISLTFEINGFILTIKAVDQGQLFEKNLIIHSGIKTPKTECDLTFALSKILTKDRRERFILQGEVKKLTSNVVFQVLRRIFEFRY